MVSFEQVREEAKKFFLNAKGSHDWSHVERVYDMCIRIGVKENADLEILKFAAILHDIGRKDQDESNGKICHAERSAVLAKELLEKGNIDEEKINKVIHCIETHRFRGNKIPVSKEAKILSDADKLDSIGAIGVGRAFLFAGEVGAKLHNRDSVLEETQPYTVEDTAYREFMIKLSKIKDRMLTQEGKRLAEERHKFMTEFFDRMNKEIDGAL
jgi:uncharacterized protein